MNKTLATTLRYISTAFLIILSFFTRIIYFSGETCELFKLPVNVFILATGGGYPGETRAGARFLFAPDFFWPPHVFSWPPQVGVANSEYGVAKKSVHFAPVTSKIKSNNYILSI